MTDFVIGIAISSEKPASVHHIRNKAVFSISFDVHSVILILQNTTSTNCQCRKSIT